MARDATSVHVELVNDLVRLVAGRLLDPLGILLGSDPEIAPLTEPLIEPLRHRIRADAEMWAAQLLGPNEKQAVAVGARLVAALYPGDTPFDPPEDWWRTPLGRAVAGVVGHPSRHQVSFAVAGAMLGITRQGVHDLVARGKLRRHPDGGVDTASVRDRLRQLARPAP